MIRTVARIYLAVIVGSLILSVVGLGVWTLYIHAGWIGVAVGLVVLTFVPAVVLAGDSK